MAVGGSNRSTVQGHCGERGLSWRCLGYRNWQGGNHEGSAGIQRFDPLCYRLLKWIDGGYLQYGNKRQRQWPILACFPKPPYWIRLYFSVSKYQTAAGTADIMSHIFEVYFSRVKDSYMQDRMAEALLKTCIKYGSLLLTNRTTTKRAPT